MASAPSNKIPSSSYCKLFSKLCKTSPDIADEFLYIDDISPGFHKKYQLQFDTFRATATPLVQSVTETNFSLGMTCPNSPVFFTATALFAFMVHPEYTITEAIEFTPVAEDFKGVVYTVAGVDKAMRRLKSQLEADDDFMFFLSNSHSPRVIEPLIRAACSRMTSPQEVFNEYTEVLFGLPESVRQIVILNFLNFFDTVVPGHGLIRSARDYDDFRAETLDELRCKLRASPIYGAFEHERTVKALTTGVGGSLGFFDRPTEQPDLHTGWASHLKKTFPQSYRDAINLLSSSEIRECCRVVADAPIVGCHYVLTERYGFDLDLLESLDGVLEFIGNNMDKIGNKCNPHPSNVFRALEVCQFDAIVAVIFGTEPQTTTNEKASADGLAFSSAGNDPSPSLDGLFGAFEMVMDGFTRPNRGGDLTPWARRGVLLLNMFLTCGNDRLSHNDMGWQLLNCLILAALSKQKTGWPILVLGEPASEIIRHFLLETETRVPPRFLPLYGPHPRQAHEEEYGAEEDLAYAVAHFIDHVPNFGRPWTVDWRLGGAR